MTRCRGKTKSGDQCRNNAIPGSDFCYVKAHVAPGQGILSRLLNFLANKYWVAILGLLGLILGVVSLWLYVQDRRRTATSGMLEPVAPEAGIYISVGRSRVILAPSTKGVFLTDRGEPVLTIHGVGGKMLVSTKIRNE